MSKQNYMTDCADSHREHGDHEGANAILLAIDDPIEAKKKYPGKKAEIDNAIAYAKQEMGY